MLFRSFPSHDRVSYNSDRNTTEASTVQPGNAYTVKQLMTTMIVDSDNNALELLYQFRKDALKEVFEDLQAPLPVSRDEIATQNFLSPKEMSKFFLVLYHGTYLKKVDSDEALQLLSQTKYRDGLVAGVPANIVVSHKYGEYRDWETDRKSTRLNSSHEIPSRMPSSA